MSCHPMGWYWGDILLVGLCPFFAGGPTDLVCFQILYNVACFKAVLNVKVYLMAHYCKSMLLPFFGNCLVFGSGFPTTK